MAEKTNIRVTPESPPGTIEQDIARTRQEMSGTVNEIQERLSPRHIKDEAKEKIRASTVDRMRNAANRFGDAAQNAGSTAIDAIRSNPIPIVMIGAGIAWLLFSRTRTGEEAGSMIAQTGSTARAKAGELSGKAQAKLEEISDTARETGAQFAGRAKESASRISRTVQERATDATGWFQKMVQNNPLGMTIALMGVGALVGFLIPESRKEQEVMGSASESLLSRARESAQKAIHKVQHAAERAVESAGEEFRKTA